MDKIVYYTAQIYIEVIMYVVYCYVLSMHVKYEIKTCLGQWRI